MAEETERLIDFRVVGRVHVGEIRASSVLSTLNVAEFGSEVYSYVESHPGLNLLLDFSNVDYLSSAVLTELLRTNKAIQETNGRLHLCAVAPTIREIFEITNLDRVFVISGDDCETSLKKFERSLDIAAQEEAWEKGPH